MKAKLIFINEKEMQATNNQFALASSVCNDQFDSEYIRLRDVVDFLQSMQNATAEEMIRMQEQTNTEEPAPIPASYHAEWRAYNYILSELKKYNNR